MDPTANGGLGALMGSINGGELTTLNFPAGTLDKFVNDFDTFGMLAAENQEAGVRTTEWYFDDLVYTTSVSQPPDYHGHMGSGRVGERSDSGGVEPADIAQREHNDGPARKLHHAVAAGVC